MKIIPNIKLRLDEEDSVAIDRAVRASGLRPHEIASARIAKKSVDARNKANIQFVCSVRIDETCDRTVPRDFPQYRSELRPIVVGFGPAGMFCALNLARHGLRPIVFERGSRVEVRKKRTDAYWTSGTLDPDCNVQFGEGGAGTFSDGKLTTLIGDPLCDRVIEDLVTFGAPPEIASSAKPHIGTDNLPRVVANLREEILSLGGEIRFDETVTDFFVRDGKICGVTAGGIRYDSDVVVLAIGHSARDTYRALFSRNVFAEPKAFSVGVRIEHLAEEINKSQYGAAWDHPKLGAADYKLVFHDDRGNNAYTFCMCPGGTVVASSSEPDGVVTNGMSVFARDGINSNSALLVGVDALLSCEAGIEFQRGIERRAAILASEAGPCGSLPVPNGDVTAQNAGTKGLSFRALAPCQRVGDFLAARPSKRFGSVLPTYRPGVAFSELGTLFDERIASTLRSALTGMDRKLKGFAHPDAVLTAPETRSSSPLRFVRDGSFQSVGLSGLYPCGEGCGYAGGIMSAAVDGLRVSNAVLQKFEDQ